MRKNVPLSLGKPAALVLALLCGTALVGVQSVAQPGAQPVVQPAAQPAGSPATPANAARDLGTPELMRALAQGGYVIYLRHGHTHWQQKIIEQAMQAEGRHDLANCATQRNLDDVGREDARGIQAALAAARIPVGEVLASLYCRPAAYVAMATGKQPQRVRWLTGLSTPESLREIRRAVATPPAPGTNTFMGGHGDRPFDLTGLVIQEGDALVFDPKRLRTDDPGKFKPVAWIKPAEWLALTGATLPPRLAAPRLADIALSTTQHHDADNLRASLPALATGQPLDDQALARQLQLARENPSRNLEVTLTAVAAARGADAPGVDASVAVADRRAAWLSAGIEHASAHAAPGTPGQDRLWLQGGHANLWNRDHQLAVRLSGTARVADKDTTSAGFAYRAPLPAWGTMLEWAGARARSAAGVDAAGEPLTGSGRMHRLAATVHLAPRGDYHHQAQLSWADHAWFGTGQADVRSRPLALNYRAHWEEEWAGWKFGLDGAANTGGGRDNDDASYAAATGGATGSGATRRWQVLRADAEWLRILTYDIRLRAAGRAQASGRALIPGEQFALGGTVVPWGSAFGLWPRDPWLHREGLRGLPERGLRGDSGALASVELWSRRLWGQDLRAGGFLDLGQVQRHRAGVGDERRDAGSTGLNLHWQWSGRLALALTAAHVFKGGGEVRDGAGRLDLVLAAKY